MADPVAQSFGYVLFGVLFTTAGFGVTTLQTYMYVSQFKADTLFVKFTVFSLLLLDTIHIAFSWHLVYFYLVQNYGNPEALAQTVWSFNMSVFLTVLITLISHCFFARRIFILSDRNYYLVSAIIALSLVRTVLGFIFAVRIWQIEYFALLPERLVPLLSAGLGAGAGSDFLIAISLVILFQKSRTGFLATDNILDRLSFYTVNNGLLTSVIGIIVVVTFAKIPGTLVYVAAHLLLSKLYANSLLATLNFRATRSGHDKFKKAPTIRLSSLQSSTDGQRRPAVIQVYTSTTTTTDRDMHHMSESSREKDKELNDTLFAPSSPA